MATIKRGFVVAWAVQLKSSTNAEARGDNPPIHNILTGLAELAEKCEAFKVGKWN